MCTREVEYGINMIQGVWERELLGKIVRSSLIFVLHDGSETSTTSRGGG